LKNTIPGWKERSWWKKPDPGWKTTDPSWKNEAEFVESRFRETSFCDASSSDRRSLDQIQTKRIWQFCQRQVAIFEERSQKVVKLHTLSTQALR
jgi:nuclear transport factor 2 (NTF2) superfamily protein